MEHFKKSKLPINVKKYFLSRDLNKIISYMTKDKKNNSNKINLILLKKIGLPVIDQKFQKVF